MRPRRLIGGSRGLDADIRILNASVTPKSDGLDFDIGSDSAIFNRKWTVPIVKLEVFAVTVRCLEPICGAR